MLSYQHMYHAGNLADVHKHSLLAWMLSYMTAKPKPMTYIETHAGRGLYRLDAAEAVKTGEAAAGIARVSDWFAADHPYAEVLAQTRAIDGPTAYPGSPIIAARMLRDGDRIHLAELHPQEVAALREAVPEAHIQQRDGAEMALALCPPDPRRGFCLIDPSYEIKDDYTALPRLVAKLHRKWPVGVIALWYPILVGTPHVPMRRTLEAAVPDAVCHEVRFPPVREGHRMIGSGLFVVNPPYGFHEQAQALTRQFATLTKQNDTRND
ncbi:23S rRNA (adenine(2030)-N(6))-methyltransferase RlmJ [Flavimaricola marinus]|uniref:Ribosomal RNA large subunit methyltransferase J n=1 Tax=Flavimaricola marinus TaxID=1819565 RepID=A0A238LIG2_9RHOB|nr:23S rRNA (adenine(2030)-N(6))-methyltransferase RlmJ [Flavimaricola marinus]SMY09507.1 Ribosomal RNA large subunit methyltransferase J [Flavimaricola marinus]